MTIKIEKIETSPTDARKVRVELSLHAQPGSSETLHFACPKFSVLEALLQVHTVDEVKPFSISAVTEESAIRKLIASGNDIKWLAGVNVEVGPIGFRAGTKNGDTRKMVQGDWSLSRMGAIASMANKNGYKSTMEEIRDGALSVRKWIQDFQYGFKRISEEIFAAEMEMLTAPEKGAW